MGTLACGVAPDFVTLMAARGLTGAFGGILGGMAMTIIGDVFPENRRGAATGILMMSFSMASVLGENVFKPAIQTRAVLSRDDRVLADPGSHGMD